MQTAIMRVQQTLQNRIERVEIKLAEAQQRLERLEIQLDTHERRTALIMSRVPRLGGDSLLNALPDDLMLAIAKEAETP